MSSLARPQKILNTLLTLSVLLTLSGCFSTGSGGSSTTAEPVTNQSNGTTISQTVESTTESLSSTDPATDYDPVTAPVSVVIEWNIPTHRTDGEPLLLSEIGGYEIIYTNTDSNESNRLVIDSPTRDRAQIDALEPGNYSFKVAAYDTTGAYSVFRESVAAL